MRRTRELEANETTSLYEGRSPGVEFDVPVLAVHRKFVRRRALLSWNHGFSGLGLPPLRSLRAPHLPLAFLLDPLRGDPFGAVDEHVGNPQAPAHLVIYSAKIWEHTLSARNGHRAGAGQLGRIAWRRTATG